MNVQLLNTFQTPMSGETSSTLLSLLVAAEVNMDAAVKDPELADSFMFKVLTKRLAYYNVKVCSKTLMFLVTASMVTSPGTSSLWVHTLYHLSRKHGVSKYDLETLCLDFADGFPTEKDYKNLWDAQKCDHNVYGTDNFLDHADAYEGWTPAI